MKYQNFSVVVEEDKDGFFAFCPELQGCYAQGETYEEALEHIKDAVQLHLVDASKSKEKIERPKSISMATVEVAV